MQRIKDEEKNAKVVHELIEMDPLRNRPSLRHALNAASFQLLSDRSEPVIGRWQDDICLYCRDGYQEIDAVMVSVGCRHYMHFACAAEILALTRRLDCALCQSEYLPWEKSMLISHELEALTPGLSEIGDKVPDGQVEVDDVRQLHRDAGHWRSIKSRYHRAAEAQERILAISELPKIPWIDDEQLPAHEYLVFQFPLPPEWFPDAQELPLDKTVLLRRNFSEHESITYVIENLYLYDE